MADSKKMLRPTLRASMFDLQMAAIVPNARALVRTNSANILFTADEPPNKETHKRKSTSNTSADTENTAPVQQQKMTTLRSTDLLPEPQKTVLSFINLGSGYLQAREAFIASEHWRLNFPKRIDLVMILMSQLVENYKLYSFAGESELPRGWPQREQIFESLDNVTILYDHQRDSVLGYFWTKHGRTYEEILLLESFTGDHYTTLIRRLLTTCTKELVVRTDLLPKLDWAGYGFSKEGKLWVVNCSEPT